MTKKLFLQATSKIIFGFLLIALILFLSAGTLRYWHGWLLIAVLFIPMIIIGSIMMIRSPQLLQKRLNTKEKEREQKGVILFSVMMFLAAFIVAGLNFRFGWMILPWWAVFAATGSFLVAYIMYGEVLRENAFLSRTIEVQENQKVIATGLYGIIRHPMYSATLLMFLSMGLILGSLISFAILLLYIPLIVIRIKNEEKVLKKGLEGYEAYCQKVKYKLIPFVW